MTAYPCPRCAATGTLYDNSLDARYMRAYGHIGSYPCKQCSGTGWIWPPVRRVDPPRNPNEPR
jgi:hypothetical protein